MKIGIITLQYNPVVGGQEIYIQQLKNLFESNLHSVEVFQPKWIGSTKEKGIIYTSLWPRLYFLERLSKDAPWFIFGFELLFFRKKISKCDLLIVNYSFHLPFISWHPNIVVLSHGVLWSAQKFSIRDTILKYNDKGLNRIKRNVRVVANDKDFLNRIGVINSSDVLTAFSKIKGRFFYLPNCVNGSKFCPDFSVIKQKVILVPRNIRPNRGIHLAVNAFSEIIKDRNDYVLVIVGGIGDIKYFHFLKEMVLEFGLQGSVRFVEKASWDEMVDYYRSSVMTLVPSTEKEGTSLSALESMACGTPVIGTSVGGLIDLPVLHCEPDAIDLQHKIEFLFDHLEQIGIAQYNKAIKDYDIKKWESFWIQIISN